MGSNPAQGTNSFSSNENVIQRVVRPWSPLNSLYIYILYERNVVLYAVRCLKSNEDMILAALAGQFKQLSLEPEKFR